MIRTYLYMRRNGEPEAFQGGCWRHDGLDDLRGFLWLPRGVSLEMQEEQITSAEAVLQRPRGR